MTDAPGPALIEARGLVKRFGAHVAVDAIDVEVHRGELFGFLGPNGAGKSSTMRMVACVSPRSGGTLGILGMDAAVDGPRIRARIGVVPQDDTLDTELTVLDNLLVYGRYFDLPRADVRRRAAELLEFAQLTERRDDLVDHLSGGMKRRLTIARALVNRPELLLLDEPTTGLDPQARHLVWERLWRLKGEGVTQVLTTHYMDEAEQLCDRLVVMDRGRIVGEGSPRELIERHTSRDVVELRFSTPEEQAAATPVLAGLAVPTGAGAVVRTEALADRVLLSTDDGEATVAAVGAADGIRPAAVLVRRSTLEDVFLTLTGRTLEEG